jgi:hypothetical protein
VTDPRAGMARIYRQLAPKIERYRDSFLAGQLYDELENYAELHGAEREFKHMMNDARNRAHMEYDTNPGGFHNWFWFLPFEDNNVAEAISKKDLLGRLQKDLPKVTGPKNKDAKPVEWTGPGKDDYGYTGYQGHGMPTDKQDREQARKKKGVAESAKPGEYYVHTVYFKDGTKKRVRVTSDEFDVVDYYTKRGQAVDHVDYDFQLHSDMTEQSSLPGTKIPQKSVMQGYTVFYDPRTKTVSVTRGGDSAEAAIEQARVNTSSLKAFRQAVERMIDKIETESINEENQDDRNARIIAGEIEDAMSLGNKKVAQEKIKKLTQLGYYFDKQGRLQRMGMYEDQVQEARGGNYETLNLRKSSTDRFAVLDRTLDAVIMTTNNLKSAKQEAIEWADYDDINTEIIDQVTGKKIFTVNGSEGAMQYLDEEQDACYRKVKSRYKVWPSAYASGALVQCRKKGADNWGTGGKKK